MKNPDRDSVDRLVDLPNVGKAIAGVLEFIGIDRPRQLIGRDPFELYERLCTTSGEAYDPCVLDVFMSVVDFMEGGDPQPWWAFTADRKRHIQKTAQSKA